MIMIDRNSFSEILREVAQIVKTAPAPMSDEEILKYFGDAELTDEQKKMVIEYVTVRPDEEQTVAKETEENNMEQEGHDSKALTMYMDELSQLGSIKDDELEDMCARLLNGDKAMVEKLAKAYLVDVADIASKYISDTILFEDLIQEGNMGLFIRLSELVGLGEDCGYDVSEEALEAAHGSIRDYVGAESGENEIENTILGKANLVGEAKKHLAELNGSTPTLQELSEYTKMSEAELLEIEDMVKRGRR